MRHKIYEESASQVCRPSQAFQLGIINETPTYSEMRSHFERGNWSVVLEGKTSWRFTSTWPFGGASNSPELNEFLGWRMQIQLPFEGFIPKPFILSIHTQARVCVGVARLMRQIKRKKSRDLPRSANRLKRSAYLTLLLSEVASLRLRADNRQDRAKKKE